MNIHNFIRNLTSQFLLINEWLKAKGIHFLYWITFFSLYPQDFMKTIAAEWKKLTEEEKKVTMVYHIC